MKVLFFYVINYFKSGTILSAVRKIRKLCTWYEIGPFRTKKEIPITIADGIEPGSQDLFEGGITGKLVISRADIGDHLDERVVGSSPKQETYVRPWVPEDTGLHLILYHSSLLYKC